MLTGEVNFQGYLLTGTHLHPPGVEVDNMNNLCEVATYMQCVKITFFSNH